MKYIDKRILHGLSAAGILSLLLCAPPAWAVEGPGSTGAGYLAFPIGPKSIAMGEVSAALAGDPFSWTSNPASLHYLEGTGFGPAHSEWLVDSRYNNISIHHRINDKFVIGGGMTYTFTPEIQGYDENGQSTDALKNNNYQLLLGLGVTPVPSLTAGVNVKYFRQTLDDWSADGVCLDVGALYTFEQVNFALGFAAQNLGPDIRFESVGEPLPLTLRLGASYGVSLGEGKTGISIACDLVKPRYESVYLSAGAELEIIKVLAIRAGYCGQEYRPDSGLTLGGGVKIRDIANIDYAWTPYGDLGSFSRISLYFTIH